MNDQFLTADLCDEFGDRLSVCSTQFRQYGARRQFRGKVRTVKCVDDNVLMRRLLEAPSTGEVLVVDAGGYLGSAIIGDLIAEIGRKNGWAGVVIHGAIRDVRALAGIDFGVKALGANPRKSGKNSLGSVDVPVSFGGITFAPGSWLYSDDDGIVVAADELR